MEPAVQERRVRRQPRPRPFLVLEGVHLVLFGVVFAGFAVWQFGLVQRHSELPGRAWLTAALAWLGPLVGPLTGVCGEGCLGAALRFLPAGLVCLAIGWILQLGRLRVPSMLRTLAWALGWGVWFALGTQVMLATFAEVRP